MPPHRPAEREQLDLFHALPGDLAPRDAQDLMAYPFFSLAKSVRTRPIDYRAGDIAIRDYDRLKAALDRLQSTTIATSIRQPSDRRMHRFSWVNKWKERLDDAGQPLGVELIVPDWFYAAVTDDAFVLTIDRAYFEPMGGLERWLYRLVRKHGGRQRTGWRFDFRHLHQKSGALSPYRRFAFELRDIVRRQPLPGYVLFVEVETSGRVLLAFEPASPLWTTC